MPLEWFGLNFNSALLTRLSLLELRYLYCPRLRFSSFPYQSSNSSFQKNAISSLNLLPELWQAYNNSYAITLLRVPTPYLKNCFLISLPDSLRTFLIILQVKVLTMNHSDPSTLQFLLSTPTIQLTFLELFNFLYSFYVQSQKYSPQPTGRTQKKITAGRERPVTTKAGPEALQLLEPAGVDQQFQLFRALTDHPRREQP